jgi:hypothetical protein
MDLNGLMDLSNLPNLLILLIWRSAGDLMVGEIIFMGHSPRQRNELLLLGEPCLLLGLL